VSIGENTVVGAGAVVEGANIVANSLRHTPPGTHVTLRVTTGGDHAVVEVEDDGPGVAPQEASRIFERFYRADQSRSRHDGGAGLGLAIVASIATAHGGHAGLRPSPGRGALFWISLPLYHPPVPAGTPARSHPARVRADTGPMCHGGDRRGSCGRGAAPRSPAPVVRFEPPVTRISTRPGGGGSPAWWGAGAEGAPRPSAV